MSIEHRIQLREKLLDVMQAKFDGCVAESAQPSTDCAHFVLFGKANFFSYPYDSPRSPLRHPDLLELIDFVEDSTLGARFDLKILVLHRKLPAATPLQPPLMFHDRHPNPSLICDVRQLKACEFTPVPRSQFTQ